MKIVLQKLIAQSGIASRHQAEKFISDGRVTVNGKKAKLGDRADETDYVQVSGKTLSFTKEHIYIKLNKPIGVVSTTRSFPGEQNVLDLVKVRRNLSIVGRLDKDSEGLVILTDDGDLAYKLTHPKFGVEKVYVVTISHDISDKKKISEVTDAFYRGINIGQGESRAKAKRFKHLRGRTFEIVLQEGKKRQIRRMFRFVGLHVAHLSRVRIAGVTVGGIRRGSWKYLTKEEIQKLKSL